MATSGATLKVLRTFTDAGQGADLYGLEIIRTTGLKSGTVYPILDRLERLGWLAREWEPATEVTDRPRRRLYRLTGLGAHEAMQTLLEHGIGRNGAWA